MSHEQSSTWIKVWSEIRPEELCETLEELKRGCLKTVTEALNDVDATFKTVYSSDMRYKGQAMTLTVDFTEEELNDTTALLTVLRSKFTEMHDKQFGFSLANAELETMRLRVKTTDASEEVDIKTIEETTDSMPPERAIMMKQTISYKGEKVEATFWDRSKISKSGYKIPGPAVITEMDSNTLILPGHVGEIDSIGELVASAFMEANLNDYRQHPHLAS